MSLVGATAPPFRFAVDASKVRDFARAVRDPHAEDETPPVPPTFPMYGVADFERSFLFDVLKLDPPRTLNAGQHYTYHRPLRIGDRLTCTARVSEDYERQGGRGGTMRFVVVEVEMRDETGALVVVSKATAVEVGAA